MPHVTHLASVLFLSDNLISKLDKMFFSFLWGGKKPKIAKPLIIQPVELSGLNMISILDMIKAIKTMWIKRLNNHVNAKWKALSWFFLGIKKESLVSITGYEYLERGCLVSYYDQVLKYWFNFVCDDPKIKKEILNKPLFNNCFVYVDNMPIKPILCLIDAGVSFLRDILNQQKMR